tara:strand:- start:38654 stop:39070 length:417 start_codon:yes stop_codon:yes gene_type:complete
MEKFFIFIGDNFVAVLLLFFFIILLIIYESRKGGKKLDSSELTRVINKDNPLVYDLRSSSEFDSGTISGAKNIAPENVHKGNVLFKANESDKVVLLCKTGSSSKTVGVKLIKEGYKDINILNGGLMSWIQQGLPLSKN